MFYFRKRLFFHSVLCLLPLSERRCSMYQHIRKFIPRKLKKATLRFSEATKRHSIKSCTKTVITSHKSHNNQCCYLQKAFLVECMITN